MFHLKCINSCVKSSLSQDYTYFVLCYQGKKQNYFVAFKSPYIKNNQCYEDHYVTIITLASKLQNAIKYSLIFLIKNSFIK